MLQVSQDMEFKDSRTNEIQESMITSRRLLSTERATQGKKRNGKRRENLGQATRVVVTSGRSRDEYLSSIVRLKRVARMISQRGFPVVVYGGTGDFKRLHLKRHTRGVKVQAQ